MRMLHVSANGTVSEVPLPTNYRTQLNTVEAWLWDRAVYHKLTPTVWALTRRGAEGKGLALNFPARHVAQLYTKQAPVHLFGPVLFVGPLKRAALTGLTDNAVERITKLVNDFTAQAQELKDGTGK